ncbi:hypothetical protein [Methyloceanibacter caenitepidi]|uniref:hypothetical protein n=1 Tax=Methyloceanibacter caenitepidi TaxID=1384459 RepID=UPI0005EFE3C5|nr:hypothetical protein [Methyloceanibacter caenitepidi]
MTVIAYRDGVLAADTACSCGSRVVEGMVKIARRKDGVLGAACGAASFVGEWLKWVTGERDDQPKPSVIDKDGTCSGTGFLFHPSGLITVFDDEGSFDLLPRYYAAGGGDAVALGAMFVGADAEAAVRAAIEHNAHCAGDISVLRHDAVEVRRA